jgi:hypothetical protein
MSANRHPDRRHATVAEFGDQLGGAVADDLACSLIRTAPVNDSLSSR